VARRALAPEDVHRPRTGGDLHALSSALRDDQLLTCSQLDSPLPEKDDALPFDDQHVLVEVVDVLLGDAVGVSRP
jgi:hypothetical protein